MKSDGSLFDGHVNLECRVGPEERRTGYVDIVSTTLDELGISDPEAAEALKKFGFVKGKVAILWQFYPLPKDPEVPELGNIGVGTAALGRLLERLESEGFAGVFAMPPVTDKAGRLWMKNGFWRVGYRKGDMYDDLWCLKF